MAKSVVTSKMKLGAFFNKFMDVSTKKQVGDAIVDAAKQMIANGQSPVRSFGRYDRYKDPKKYPGDRKPARPVNLELTGEMLRFYGWQEDPKDENAILIGLLDSAPDDVKIRFEAHQLGTKVLPARRLVPIESRGETWAISIMQAVKELYGRRLSAIIKKSKGE